MNALQQRHARRVCGRQHARRAEVLELYRAARPLMDHETHRRPRRGEVVFEWRIYPTRFEPEAYMALCDLAGEVDPWSLLGMEFVGDELIVTFVRSQGHK
jgi:hypothetical protein